MFAGSNPDTVNGLSVDLTASAGSLSSTTAASAAAGVALCYVDGEYLSYTTATLTAANIYNLTGLFRGLDGSNSSSHSSGGTFCLLDSAILQYDIATAQIGQGIYLKFQSFNIFGCGLQDLSTCVAYPYTIQGTGATGPVAAALAVGASMDFGLVNQTVAERDDFGSISSPVTLVIDLGMTTG